MNWPDEVTFHILPTVLLLQFFSVPHLDVDIMTPSFDGMSYIELSYVMDTENTRLQLSFNPSSPDGYLLYAGNYTPATPDFLSLLLVNGRVELRYELGSGVQVLVSDAVSLNIWHTVFVTRELRTASMVVDGVHYGPVDSPGGFAQLNIEGVVNIGGLRNYSILAPLANADIMGFSGCITRFLMVSREYYRDVIEVKFRFVVKC